MISTQLKITGQVILDEQHFMSPVEQMCAWFDADYLEFNTGFLQLFEQGCIVNLFSAEWHDEDPSHIDLNLLYHSNDQESAAKFKSSDLFKKHVDILQNHGLTVEIATIEDFDMYQPWTTTTEIAQENIYWIPSDMVGTKPKKMLWQTQYPIFDENNELTQTYWEVNQPN